MWLFNNKTMKSRKRISICTGVGAWPLRIFFSCDDYFWILTLTRDLKCRQKSAKKQQIRWLLIGCLDGRQTPNTKEASMCQTSIIFELCLGSHTKKKRKEKS